MKRVDGRSDSVASPEDGEQEEPLLSPSGEHDKDSDDLIGHAYRIQKYSDLEFEDALSLLGFGAYQIKQFLLLSFTGFLGSLHMISAVFLCASPKHRCHIPSLDKGNGTYSNLDDVPGCYAPIEFVDGEYKSSECRMYEVTSDNDTCHPSSSTPTTPCTSYLYDESVYVNTIVTDWDLVCDDAYLKSLSESVFMAGVLFGAFIFGIISDKYGRKLTVCISLTFQFVFGLATAVTPEIITFCISRFVEGACISGVYLTAFVMGNEMVLPRLRTYVGALFHLPGTLGSVFLGVLAYYIRDWRWLEIAFSLPGILALPYWWIVDDSVRWLMANGRHSKAEEIFRKAANSNSVQLPPEFSLKKHSEIPGSRSVLDLLRTPNLRKNALIIFYGWFVCSLVFYAVQLNIEGLPGNDYVVFEISALVEIPSVPICLYSMQKLGRKPTLLVSLLTGAFSITLVGFVPKSYTGTTITLAMICKLFMSLAFAVVYQFSVELFPTIARNIAIGSSSMFARVGGILAPFVILLEKHFRWLPYLILGGSGFLATCLTFFVPETVGKHLPETLEEGEMFGKKEIGSVLYKKNANINSSSTVLILEDNNKENLSDEDDLVYTKMSREPEVCNGKVS